MKSLYAKYIEEREGLNLYETDKGFMTYEIEKNVISICDLFILKEFRNGFNYMDFCRKVIELGKGCDFVAGAVCEETNGWQKYLSMHLKSGFKEVKRQGSRRILLISMDNFKKRFI